MFVRTLIAALLVFAAPALAQEQSAGQFLHSIYDQYKGQDAPPLDNAALGNYFTPELAGLINADSDQASAKGEVPRLDGDPFIDAQDWKITNLNIAVEETKPGFATATVSFQNFERMDEIRLDLLKLTQGWRIAEIYAPSGRLRELFGQ